MKLISATDGTITTNELHEFEANVDWDEGYVFYHVDGIPVAVMVFNKISSTMSLMCISLRSNDRDSGQSIVDFYGWTTQVRSYPMIDIQ